ncbi:MAG: hypothetical protein GY803_17945 [Chloroflexi bacterium]|nr:hypothetical protein [Chloroflexota bacterium]
MYTRKEAFSDSPQVARLAQWGSYVLMGIESESGDFAAECWVENINKPMLTHCEEAK